MGDDIERAFPVGEAVNLGLVPGGVFGDHHDGGIGRFGGPVSLMEKFDHGGVEPAPVGDPAQRVGHFERGGNAVFVLTVFRLDFGINGLQFRIAGKFPERFDQADFDAFAHFVADIQGFDVFAGGQFADFVKVHFLGFGNDRQIVGNAGFDVFLQGAGHDRQRHVELAAMGCVIGPVDHH
ncbi:hypothetical protein SDC9_125995 [bioreactor metagenome]|uniref:Uncharacterized protein n=1 Tax=bioreactor metagenome TaxID=1076179 RepID=A0A645CPG5_9ZZZZ